MAGCTLYEAFQEVPDPRWLQGQRHPPEAILTLLAVAMLSGCRGQSAVAQFGRDRPELAEALGFTREKTPCCASLHYFLKRLEPAAFERAVACWLGVEAPSMIAMDGKTLTGSGDGSLPGLHLLSAYAPEAGATLRSLPVGEAGDKTNEHRRALEMLEILPVQGAVVTGDAMFCQRELSEKVREKGGTSSGR